MEFVDRLPKCSDCGSDFIFTSGEQLFFYDKQFKNDPKRCKLCKAKRAGLGRGPNAANAVLPLSRTETRATCSACGIETTVPFKPTQGRPVLCRPCFQLKRVPTAVSALDSPEAQIAEASAALESALAAGVFDQVSLVESLADRPVAALDPSEVVSVEILSAALEVPQA